MLPKFDNFVEEIKTIGIVVDILKLSLYIHTIVSLLLKPKLI